MFDLNVTFRRADFSLEVAFQTDDPISGVFGASGAGKTTLLHLIAGLERPDVGHIRIDGQTLFSAAERINLPPHRRRVGLVFQDGRLFPHYSVRGNLRYARRRDDQRNDITNPIERAHPHLTFDRVVELLELERLLDRRVHQLSGGERQRVALGRALLSAPRLLLLDEPLASLDRHRKQQILPFLQRVRDAAGIPTLYVSHDLSEILQLTDRLLVIDGGRLLDHGPLREVVRHDSAWPTLLELGVLNVLELIVIEHDCEAGLTRLASAPLKMGIGSDAAPAPDEPQPPEKRTHPVFQRAPDAPILHAPLRDLPIGRHVHVSIRPEDIALAQDRVEGTSIQNQLPGKIVNVTSHADRAVAEIDIGFNTPLLLEVSFRTVKRMALDPGRGVWCLIKSNAVTYLNP